MISNPIYIPMDLVGLPFHCKGVEVIGNWLAKIIDLPEAVTTRIARAMDRSKDLIWQASDVFHDVNLAGLGPSNPVDIRTQAPKRWPQPGSAGNFDARFDTPISNFKLILGQEPGRGVLARTIIAKQ